MAAVGALGGGAVDGHAAGQEQRRRVADAEGLHLTETPQRIAHQVRQGDLGVDGAVRARPLVAELLDRDGAEALGELRQHGGLACEAGRLCVPAVA